MWLMIYLLPFDVAVSFRKVPNMYAPSASWAIDSEPIRARGIIVKYFTDFIMTWVNNVCLLREGFVIKGSVESRFYMNCLFIPVAETKNGEMVENFLF